MALFRRPPARTRPAVSSGTALVAAAKRLDEPSSDERDRRVRHAAEWQQRAFEYLTLIPEVEYASRYMGDAFARMRLFVGVRPDPNADPVQLDPEGDPELGYSKAEAATCAEVLAGLTSPEGGQSEIQRRFGVQLAVPGEAYLVGRPLPGSDEQRWDVYSIRELGMTERAGGFDYFLRRRGQSSGGTQLPEDTVVSRIWRPDAEYSQEAVSPMRSAEAILDELLVLTKAIRSGALSRLAGAGWVFLPNSARDGGHNTNADETDGQGATVDRVVTDLITVAAAAINDPASAAARVPLVTFMDDAVWEKMSKDKMLTWDHDIDKVAGEQRAELIRRFAAVVDIPAEVLTGMGDVKYWNLEYIGAEGFRAHIEPAVVIMDDGLTRSYLRPGIETLGMPNPERFWVWHDPGSLVADPDRVDNSKTAHGALVISDARHRDDLGYSDEDAPEPEELLRRVAIEAARGGRLPVLLEPPAFPPQAITASARDTFDGLTDRLAEMDTGLLLTTHQLADSAMHRALERANSRIKTLAQRDNAAKPMLARVPPVSFMVAPTLGPALVERLTAGDDLFAGVFEPIRERYLTRVERVGDEVLLLAQKYGGAITAALEDEEEAALLLGGRLGDAEADQLRAELGRAREGSWDVLHAALLVAAASLLFRPEPGGPPGEVDGTLVGTGTVRNALARAGGGGARATSMLTGDLVDKVFSTAGIIFGGWIWKYGDASLRLHNFEPHHRLDQVRFSSPNDDVLGNTSGWPHVSYFAPGDHKGCQCSWARTAPQLAPVVAVPSLARRN